MKNITYTCGYKIFSIYYFFDYMYRICILPNFLSMKLNLVESYAWSKQKTWFFLTSKENRYVCMNILTQMYTHIVQEYLHISIPCWYIIGILFIPWSQIFLISFWQSVQFPIVLLIKSTFIIMRSNTFFIMLKFFKNLTSLSLNIRQNCLVMEMFGD